MNNELLKTFENAQFGKIRVTVVNDKPMLCLVDVCNVLDLTNPSMVKQRLRPKGVTEVYTPTNGGIQKLLFIDQPNFYRAVFQSKKPEAEIISDWVVEEVLPSIFETGSYSLQKPDSYMIEDPRERAVRWLEEYDAHQEEIKALESQVVVKDQQLALMQPKAEFFDAVTDSKKAIPLGDAAKILDMGIGRNKLFEFLRQKHILMQNNQPYQQYIDAGYFRVVEQKYEVHGEVRINIKTLVFQKGIDWIRKQLLKGV